MTEQHTGPALAVPPDDRPRAADRDLRRRARAVIPGGMYGHQSAGPLPGVPPVYENGRGARVWDVDGNEYVDLMCSYGPVVLGHQHPAVEAAAAAQAARATARTGPARYGGAGRAAGGDGGARRLGHVGQERHRRHDHLLHHRPRPDRPAQDPGRHRRLPRGRALVHAAAGRRHRGRPGQSGLLHLQRPGQRPEAAADAGDDLAGILVSPFRHDAGFDQELVDPAFARGLRELCDAAGAALILDDVRCGFRLHLGSSWEPVGVDPDLSAWSKAIANGHALAAVLGRRRLPRRGRATCSSTGSFWFAAVPMAAAVATIGALRDEGAIEAMDRMGTALREGIVAQAQAWDLPVRYTGPPAMPYLTFDGDTDHELASVFAARAVRGGAYLHPRHNWFVSAAMTGTDLALVLEATDQAFAAVRKRISQS